MKSLNYSELFDKNGNISSGRLKKYGEDTILKELSFEKLSSTNAVEHLYWYTNNLIDYPKECKTCLNKITKFYSFKIGYKIDFCSLSCMQQNNEIKDKKVNTMRLNFGEDVQNPSQLSTSNQKKIISGLQRRGTEWPTQHPDVLKKRVKTYIDRYGVSNPNQSKVLLAKRIKTYSLTVWNQRLLIELKTFEVTNLRWDNDLETCVVDFEGDTLECSTVRSIIAKRKIKLIGNSSLENKLLSLLEPLGHKIILNSRSIIKPLEIDIYFPDLKIGIEVNGNYWHSSEIVHHDYHLLKTKMAISKGIRLVHVFEHELNDKFIGKTFSSLLHLLQKSSLNEDARKLQIREVSKIQERTFLSVNHRQGFINSMKCWGLFKGDELLGCMSFGKNRFKRDDLELLRFAVSNNLNIRGGASKLLKHAKEQLKLLGYTSLTTYSHLRWGQGFYEKVGFSLSHISAPGYFYVKNTEIVNRIKAQKHKLKNFLSVYDENLTEEKNMKENGYLKIYDCGCEVFTMDLTK